MSIAYFIRTNIINIILITVVLLFISYKNGLFGWGSIPEVRLETSKNSSIIDPCQARSQCVIAYVAPWCPACHSSIGFLNTLGLRLLNSSKVGMKIIIGMAEVDQLEGMAQKFSSPAFYDPDGEFASKVGINSVPNVLLVDSSGKIIEKGLPGAVSGFASQDEAVNYYIKNILGISDLT